MNFGYVTVNGVNSNTEVTGDAKIFNYLPVKLLSACNFIHNIILPVLLQIYTDFTVVLSGKRVTVHSVHSNVAKIHSRLPAAMEFWLVCLGILAYSCQNTSRDSGV